MLPFTGQNFRSVFEMEVVDFNMAVMLIILLAEN
jgi:hypothetical protein